MPLIKKTIFLTDTAQKTRGYVTVVVLGEENGIKIVLNDAPPANSFAVLITPDNEPLYIPLDGVRTEKDNIPVQIKETDEFECGIFSEDDEKLFASGFINKDALSIAKHAFKVSASVGSEGISAQKGNQNTAKQQPKTPFNMRKSADFFLTVKPRLDEILMINPNEKDLNELIPNSRFVKVFYIPEDYYVVGEVLSDKPGATNRVKYIVYGVPGIKTKRPPKDAEKYCDFFPVPSLAPAADGYWLIFQNTEDGKIVGGY